MCHKTQKPTGATAVVVSEPPKAQKILQGPPRTIEDMKARKAALAKEIKEIDRNINKENERLRKETTETLKTTNKEEAETTPKANTTTDTENQKPKKKRNRKVMTQIRKQKKKKKE